MHPEVEASITRPTDSRGPDQRGGSTTTIEERLEIANRLLRLVSEVGSRPTLESTLDTIFESFSDLIPFDRIEYASADDQELLTRWVRANYETLHLTPGFTWRLRKSPTEMAAELGSKPYVDVDIWDYAAKRPPGHPAHYLAKEGLRSGLSCPLVVDGEVVGFLFFGSRTPGAYSASHVDAISRITDIVAGTIAKIQLTDELRQRNRDLEELTSFRTRYLAVVGHELRTPLTAVVGIAQALDEGLDDFSADEVKEMISLLADQSTETVDIVEDLLLIARAEFGNLEINRETVDISKVVRSVVEAMIPGISITGTAGTATADAGRVRQIIRNLISNAQRYGGERIWIELTTGDRIVAVDVCDDGEGIPEENQGSVFDPFVGDGRKHTESIGIGLWVARQLADAMGGSLNYVRSDDRTCFRLELPSA